MLMQIQLKPVKMVEIEPESDVPLEIVAVELVLHADVGEKAGTVVRLARLGDDEDVPDVVIHGGGRVCIAAFGIDERRTVD